MDILETHGTLSLPGRGEVEVTLDLYDPPRTDDVLPRGWTAVVTSGPDLAVGEQGLLFLAAQDGLIANPFTVLASDDRTARIAAHDPS
ncbi:hypothetical protein [Embleya sp. NPDC005971]|uniref:hypothetical protein n=1 Tax=unclassified Embleya TaxID=2699296 RepID=UPI0034118809